MPLLLFLWLLATTGAFVVLQFTRFDLSERRHYTVVIAVGVVVHLVPLLLYPNAEGFFQADVDNYGVTAQRILDRQDAYELFQGFIIHPYLPFQMFVLAGAKLVANATNLPFFFVLRIPQALADVGTAALITYGLRGRVNASQAFIAGLSYAVCPLPMFVAVYHGQFDGISVFFAVASASLLMRSVAQSRLDLSAVALGLGTLQKFWPGFLLFVLVSRIPGLARQLRFVAIAGGVVMLVIAAYVAAFDSSLAAIRDGTLDYQTPFVRSGGLVLALDRFPDVLPGRDRLVRWWIDRGEIPTMVAMLAISCLMVLRRVDPVPASIAVLCVFFALIPNGDSYHYVWVVPFGIMAGHRAATLMVVLGATAIYAIFGFFGGALFLPPIDGPASRWTLDHAWWISLALWGTFVAWALVITMGAFGRTSGRSADVESPAVPPAR
jgi:hypothetical protein